MLRSINSFAINRTKPNRSPSRTMHWKSKCPPGDLPEVPIRIRGTHKNKTMRILIVVIESMIILSHLPLPDTDRDETSLFRKWTEPFTFTLQLVRQTDIHRTPNVPPMGPHILARPSVTRPTRFQCRSNPQCRSALRLHQTRVP